VKIIKTIFLASFIFILSIFFYSKISNAESLLGVTENNINVKVSPENPKPGDSVTLKLTSYAININKSMIVWQNNNQVLVSGYGKDTYTFTAGANGSMSVFNVKITLPDSSSVINKEIIIIPSDIDILWEANDSYTPPFYKGKAFPSQEGSIKVVAIPNSDSIKSGSGDVIYTWTRNDEAMQNVSGYNKNSFIFKNSVLKDIEKISVSVSTIDGKYNASDSLELEMSKPLIIFYEKSSTLGILYNNGTKSEMDLDGDNITIVAEPFFLSLRNSTEDAFNYYWEINDEEINTPSKKTEITVSPTSKGGYAEISIEIESLSKLFQQVTGTLKLNL